MKRDILQPKIETKNAESKYPDLIDVRGSVLHSIIYKENPTRSNSVSEFYYIFI